MSLSTTAKATASSEKSVTRIETLEARQLLAATAFPVDLPSVPDNSILFVNFDNGGEGVAFHDADKRNKGGEYRRANSGVDIQWNSDAPAPNLGTAPGEYRSVGNTQAGEWLTYTVDVATAGTYTFEMRYASATGGRAHVEVDGRNVTGSLSLSSTGGWDEYATIDKAGINLTAGKHVVKFAIDSSTWGSDVADLHWFRFSTPMAPMKWPKGWERVADAPEARFEAMSHTMDGKVYVFGGFKDSDYRVSREYSVFDPDTQTWTQLGTLPRGMAETHTTPVDDGRFIYFVGGFAGDLDHGGDGPTQRASNLVYRYDPAKNKWALISHIPELQGGGGSAIVGRTLHFFGGTSEDRVTNVGNHYVIDLDNVEAGWSKAAAMPDAKDHFSTVVLDGKIYEIGGEYGHDEEFDTQQSVHMYDPKTDRWTRLSDLPIASGHAEGSTFVLNGRIVFAGGQVKDTQAATDRVFAYNPSNDRWSELNSLPTFLQGAVVTVVDSQIVAMLGARYTQNAQPWTFVGSI